MPYVGDYVGGLALVLDDRVCSPYEQEILAQYAAPDEVPQPIYPDGNSAT